MSEVMVDAAAVMANETNELSCVVIPASGEQLLLPNVCVAEIVPWRRIKVLEDGPAWCLGYMGWRSLTIPVVHYGGFGEKRLPAQTPRCLVVMNRARTTSGVDFYALVADALPRMVQLIDADLTTEGDYLSGVNAMQVAFGTETATIPDLAYLETRISDLVHGLRVS